jgi:peptidoglycan/LPS O-acetylase OafA/YrhL
LNSARYHSLDLWRGLACVLVVVVHSAAVYHHTGTPQERWWAEALTGWCEVGVPLFFVISGYCIAATADATRRKGGGSGEFFLKRFRRIFPPYWAAVGAQAALCLILDVWLWPGLLSGGAKPLPPPWSRDGWQWAGSLTLTESWREHAAGSDKAYLLGQAWTLCYEEQFYAVVGLGLLLFRKRLLAGLGVVTVAVLAMDVALRKFGMHDRVGGFFFDGKWLQFACGVLVYVVTNYGRGWGWRAAAGGAILLLLGYGWRVFQPDLLAAAAFATGLVVLKRWDAPVAAWKPLRPVAWCGTMCYSLYLTHMPVARGISQAAVSAGLTGWWAVPVVTVCVLASAGFGWLFYLGVERWFVTAPPRRSPADDAGAAAGGRGVLPGPDVLVGAGGARR